MEQPLRLTINGRIIDHLGIQMYQSPVAAIAELISNGWDADSTRVDVILPEILNNEAEIIISDNGIGMTYNECQNRYLNVGAGRREKYKDKTPAGRPVLGRKGIGKFAGFGIAQIIYIETISKETGEKTSFSLDVNKIRTEEYTGEGIEVDNLKYLGPDKNMIENSGTKIILKKLKLQRLITVDRFIISMARKFLVHQTVDDFDIFINNIEVPTEADSGDVQYSFPRDYDDEEITAGLTLDGEWGIETLSNGKEIKWRFNFHKETVGDEELRGVAVFARGKLIQKSFFFNLSGGLGGQLGQQYLSGQVLADYIDELPEDVIAPERQRVNWESEDTIPLEEWGQQKVSSLLILWKKKRGEKRQKEIEDRLTDFSGRIDLLQKHEAKTIRKALKSLGGIETLNDKQFQDLGSAILTAWEQGRLHELISDMSEVEELDPVKLLNLFTEVNVLDALNIAEAVKVKSETINGLRKRIQTRELENDLRDYIANNPWLLSSKWETFKVEIGVNNMLREAAAEAGLDDEEYRGRIDLALRSGDQLLVIEFMRPGLSLDFDHAGRCERYIYKIRSATEATTALGIKTVKGLIVADNLDKRGDMVQKIKSLEDADIIAHSWDSLLNSAAQEWSELINILIKRNPEDPRLQSLV